MSQRLPGTGTCLIPVSLYMCYMVYSGLSLKTEVEGRNKKEDGGSRGLAYCYIMFEMQ